MFSNNCFAPVVGEIIVYETSSGFVIGKLINWNDEKGFFDVEKAYQLIMPDPRELPPDLQQKVRENPNAMPIGFAPIPPFYEGGFRVMISRCNSIGAPRASARALYVKNTSNIVLSTQMPQGV